MLKVEDIRKMTTEELVKKSTELRVEVTEMRRRVHMGEVQNPRVLRIARRDLARVLTVLGEEFAKENA